MNLPVTSENATPLISASDLSGLAVHDAEDLLSGHVTGVLIEAEAGLIRFIDVQLDSDGRHVLVPVGHARLEHFLDQARIRLRAATLHDLEHVPAYDQSTELTSGYVHDLAVAYGRFFRGDFYYAHPAYEHRNLYAGAHPIVRAESQPVRSESQGDLTESRELTPLRESDFRISSGEPDVRGWTMVGSDNISVGTVEELLIDPIAERVRYLTMRDQDKLRLMPIGYVNLSGSDQRVVVPGLTAADIVALPAFMGDVPTREQEIVLLDAIERALDARNPFLRVEFSDRQLLPE